MCLKQKIGLPIGSRARGDYKTTSDVDLAIASKADILTPLQIALEDSRLPYTFDLIDYFRQ
ncbi:nucleotidyltransferase domain-containing protein [Acidaminococcus massiliensis]|uniref:nucleotidyltransferase domain-containing protein n=1 Tax=Acidaminococcus massiliensis TaxID=1852375 RepID=UPI00349F3E9E